MSETTKSAVRKGYGAVAQAGLSSDDGGIKSIAKAFGYSEEELSSIPAASNMGLSCGNPVAMASIREGETVVDLGAGGGLDVFLASKKVGPAGKAIGMDMTGDMVSLARKNAEKGGYTNVKFYLAEIEAMPLQDNSVDCVISNCVLNLCTDKDAAFQEIHRILKPGGRLAVSDIALKKPLPAEVAEEVAAWTGCIAGAMTINENRSKLANAGFGQVEIQDAGSDLNAYREGGSAVCCGPESQPDESSSCCGPAEEAPAAKEESACCAPATEEQVAAAEQAGEEAPCCDPSSDAAEVAPTIESSGDETEFHDRMGKLLDTFDVNEYAASVKISAVKPA